jgi:hypothetical protein
MIGCALQTPAPARTPAPVAPTAPAWTSEAPPAGLVWGLGVDSFQNGIPARLQRDLGDVAAYEAVRRDLRSRVEALPVGVTKEFPKTLGATLGRASYPGCRIVVRECRDGSQGRQWCWARAQLDATDLLPVLEREFGGGGASVRDSLVRTLLNLP